MEKSSKSSFEEEKKALVAELKLLKLFPSID